MRKIPTLFQRGKNFLVVDSVHPDCEWVLHSGIATRKLDGTACLVKGGKLYKRREIKAWDKVPEGFIKVGMYGHKFQGWVPITMYDRWHLEAFNGQEDGTYELMGPKIQGNPDKLDGHYLIRHGSEVLPQVPRDFDNLRMYLLDHPNWEGIVFHNPDGLMAKIKRSDYFR